MKRSVIMTMALVQLFIVMGVVSGIMLVNGTANQYFLGELRCWVVAIGSAISYVTFMTLLVRQMLTK